MYNILNKNHKIQLLGFDSHYSREFEYAWVDIHSGVSHSQHHEFSGVVKLVKNLFETYILNTKYLTGALNNE